MVCVECRLPHGLEEFSTKKGRDDHICRACRQRLAAAKISAHLARKRGLNELTLNNKKLKEINAPHISEYADVMFEEMGGLRQVVKRHIAQIDAAEAAEPGSKRVLEAYKSLVALIEKSTVHRQTAPDVISMSDAEIELEKCQLLLQAVAEDRSGDMLTQLRDLLGGNVFDEVLDATDQTAVVEATEQ
jgi:hypothetical protein